MTKETFANFAKLAYRCSWLSLLQSRRDRVDRLAERLHRHLGHLRANRVANRNEGGDVRTYGDGDEEPLVRIHQWWTAGSVGPFAEPALLGQTLFAYVFSNSELERNLF